ncbi:MAG: glycosyltransferase family 4 protein [Planctomycetes bacterium]|nr:glycosyltransferase family 4 protein [Planctomycetota bacterium]
MKVLHLYNDWKWTGPSEPVLNLCKGLKTQGLEIHIACLAAPDNKDRTLPSKAAQAGIPLLTLATPAKYLSIFYLKPHINALAKYIEASHNFDIIHCHSALDHYYASKLKTRFPTVKIIRTNHKGYPLESTWTNKSLMKKAINGYITLSKNLAETDRKNFGLAPEKTAAIPSGIDISVFTNSTKPVCLTNIKGNDIVIGIVARVQRHRRFHIIIEAMQSIIKEMPNVKLVVVGRGTYYNQLVTEPVKRLGLENNVISAGYRTNDYLDILNTFDFGLFLVPGSDGSCRAALEIMASGKPLIVANRGILPEIVDDDKNGLVIDDTPNNLTQAILKLAKDRQLRERFGQSARAKVEQQFTLERTVRLTQEIYQNISK